MSCCDYSRTSRYRLFLTFLAFAAVDRIPFEPGLLCPLTGLLLEMKQIMYGEHRTCVHRGNNTPSYKTPDSTDMWIILFARLMILSKMLSRDFTEVCQD